MTGRPPKRRTADRRARRPQVLSVAVLLGMPMLMLLGALSPAAAVVLGCGMLPTAAVLLVDWSEGRQSTLAVGGMNLAGVFPFLPPLFARGNHIAAAADTFADLFALTTMYGAAAIGWILVGGLPALFEAIHHTAVQRRIAEMRTIQRGLIAEWGPQVVGAAETTTAPAVPVATAEGCPGVVR